MNNKRSNFDIDLILAVFHLTGCSTFVDCLPNLFQNFPEGLTGFKEKRPLKPF